MGSYGDVLVAVRKHDGKRVAVKKARLEQGIPYTTLREIACLRRAVHKNLVPLIDLFASRSHACLVFPAFQEDLFALLARKGPLGLTTIQKAAEGLFSALAYLHGLKIIHRDLKPSNILVDHEGGLHIADFGLAKWSDPFTRHTKQMVTLQYRAPEILLDDTLYREQSDIWSMGCILAEMATGKIIFCGHSQIEQLRLLTSFFDRAFSEEMTEAHLKTRLLDEPLNSDDGNLERVTRMLRMQLTEKAAPKKPRSLPQTDARHWLTERFIRLVAACLCYNPDDRCTAADAHSHEFFSAMDID